MSTVLGIVGSPRKQGNTYAMVSQMLAGAAAQGANTEMVFLGDLTIKECTGCHVCWRGNPCSKRDDMNALYERLNQADALVLGTPVYWYGATALMKGFVDRLVYYSCLANHALISGKPALVAIPFEETEAETVAPVVQFFEKSLGYLGLHLNACLTAGGLAEVGAAAMNVALMQKAYAQGAELLPGNMRL